MYKMKADGVVFYDPSSDDAALQVLSPKAKYELNKAGSLTFTLLPGNVMYDGLQKMKTIVTLEQDGEMIFRGRVLETTTDAYNQRSVYCEGELAYLLDSLVRPYQFEGKASDLFRQLVETHNEQVEDYKQFQVGIVSAVDDEDTTKTDNEAYTDTLAEIRQMLINPFDGYLRIRVENGVRYLDWIDEYDDECGQAIEFGVNLVDIENKLDAGDICTVLVPLGGVNSKYQNLITIAEVNGGKDYLEDAEAIAQYGRIVKTFKWEDITDPQEIMEEGLKQFEKMKEARTLTIKAVDLHIIDASVDSIRLGMKVKLLSSPHGLNEPDICSKIDLDVEKPENTEYTFGIPQESLTDKNASRVRQYESAMGDMHKWLWETEEGLFIAVENMDALGNRTTNLKISVDAVEEAITLKADKAEVDEVEQKVSNAEIRLDAAEAAILLKASQSDMDDVFLRLDGAEDSITAQASTINLKADKTYVDNLVADRATITALNAVDAELSNLTGGLVTATVLSSNLFTGNQLDVTYANVDSLTHGGELVSQRNITMGDVSTVGKALSTGGVLDLQHSHSVTVNSDGTITLGEVATTGGTFKIADTAYYKEGVSAARTAGINSVTLSGAGWVGGSYAVNASNGNSFTVELPTFYTSGGTSFNSSHQTTVYFFTDSVSGPLKSAVVDASSVYDGGYDAGYADAFPASVSRVATYDSAANAYNVTAAVMSADGTSTSFDLVAIDASAAYDAGYAAGYQAAKDAVKLYSQITWSNPAQNYARVSVYINATVDGEEVESTTNTSSQNVSGYV